MGSDFDDSGLAAAHDGNIAWRNLRLVRQGIGGLQDTSDHSAQIDIAADSIGLKREGKVILVFKTRLSKSER